MWYLNRFCPNRMRFFLSFHPKKCIVMVSLIHFLGGALTKVPQKESFFHLNNLNAEQKKLVNRCRRTWVGPVDETKRMVPLSGDEPNHDSWLGNGSKLNMTFWSITVRNVDFSTILKDMGPYFCIYQLGNVTVEL